MEKYQKAIQDKRIFEIDGIITEDFLKNKTTEELELLFQEKKKQSYLLKKLSYSKYNKHTFYQSMSQLRWDESIVIGLYINKENE